MLAASDGTMEFDLSDIDELAGTGVIILRASLRQRPKGRSKIGPARVLAPRGAWLRQKSCQEISFISNHISAHTCNTTTGV
jgi:hypothetical protein